MDVLSANQLRLALISAAGAIVEAEPYLTQVDTIIGDGDHGSGMKTGFTALKSLLENSAYETPYDLFHQAGLCLIKTMGGASGVLFGTLFTGGLASIKVCRPSMRPSSSSLFPAVWKPSKEEAARSRGTKQWLTRLSPQ